VNGSRKKFFPKDELGLCPKFTTKDSHTSLPRSRSHNKPTNPRNKPQLKAKRKRNSRSKGLRQSTVPGADGPRWTGGQSVRTRRTVRKIFPNNQYRTSKYGRSVIYPRTVREQPVPRGWSETEGGRSAKHLQRKPSNFSDRNASHSRTKEPVTNTCPRGLFADQAQTVRQAQTELLELENERSTPFYPSMVLPNGLSS
jgi:hypothetical protein